MSSMRVLLIGANAAEADRISSVLAEANHEVLRAKGFSEASDVLLVQRFDAVLVGAPEADGLVEFTSNVRQLERKRRSACRTTILSFAPEAALRRSADELGIDGFLPKEFEAATFSEAVKRLSHAVSPSTGSADSVSSLPILVPEEFRAQVAYDSELLIEIIELFLADSPEQLKEMQKALAAGDCQWLSRAAHTIKGSLGSLHAEQAKAHAQQLELAAKNQEDQICRFALAALEQDLEILKPHLLALRESESVRQ